jgi:hypothetical protein
MLLTPRFSNFEEAEVIADLKNFPDLPFAFPLVLKNDYSIHWTRELMSDI